MKNKKFNLFDLLIVIIIIGIAAALIFRNQIKDVLVNTQLKTFTVTVHCENVSNDAIDKSMTVGSEMQRPSSSKAFGVIKEVKKTPLSEEFIYIDRQVQMQSMQFSELAIKDALTGIRNKTGYDKEVEKVIKGLERGDTQFGVAIVDLNDLKKINDEYGHDKGNEAIKNLCRLVCTTFEHSPVFRIGGDEFAVILKGSDYDRVEELMGTFNERIDKISKDESLEFWDRASAAIGYALYTEGRDFVYEDVFKRADEAMYARKNEMKAARE